MYNFDEPFLNDPKWDGKKWRNCKNGEIPMFVAVMDFMIPPPITAALKERLEFPSFGYDNALGALHVLPSFYERMYGCNLDEDWIVHVLSVMPGVNTAIRAVGGEIMYCTPVYSHFRKLSKEAGVRATEVPMKQEHGIYFFDFDAMEAAYKPEIKSFILCNPHNPIGRVYRKEELEDLVSWCHAHDMVVISDEIHGEFIFEGKHVPLFSCCEQAKKGTITVASPNKICNTPRLPMGFAIIPDETLRTAFIKETHACFGRGEAFNSVAFQTAYDGSCDHWKQELIVYLRENRDCMEERIKQIPGISVNHNQATYLAWIDCKELGLKDPRHFFEKEAKVIVSGGNEFNEDNQYIRLNFGCPRSQLMEALDRMENAIRKLRKYE